MRPSAFAALPIYNESDALTAEIDELIFWIVNHARHSYKKRANAENHCAKGGSDGQNVCGFAAITQAR